MAIPFFRNNLVGNLIFVPVGIRVASKVLRSIKEKGYEIKKHCCENS